MRVYKKTLIVCTVIFCILTILSTILNFWNDIEWIEFIVNWCVGIACSIFVVIITTYIQFKAENHKISVELATNSLVWLSKFYELSNLLDKSTALNVMDNSKEYGEIISDYIEGFTETTYKCFVLSYEYVSISRKSLDANKNLNYVFAMVHKLCTSKEYDEKPVQLIQKLKIQINIMQFLEDFDVFLKPDHFHYIKTKLNELIKINNTSQVK